MWGLGEEHRSGSAGKPAGYLIAPGLWACSGKSLAALNTPGLPEGLAPVELLGRRGDQNESSKWEGRSTEGKGKRGHVPGHLLVVGSGQKSRGAEPSTRVQRGEDKGGSATRAEPSCYIHQFLIDCRVQCQMVNPWKTMIWRWLFFCWLNEHILSQHWNGGKNPQRNRSIPDDTPFGVCQIIKDF